MLRKDVRNFSLLDRVIDEWNALSKEIVCGKKTFSLQEKYEVVLKTKENKLDSILYKYI